jgi:[ribosomal protein S18]-alanine N-acetyltransferase
MDLTNTRIEPINTKHIETIIHWRYEPPYDIYNMDMTEETINNFLNRNYYVLLGEFEELLGYYCYGEEATIPYGNIYKVYENSSYTDIGLGMNPKYVSQGLGLDFLNKGLDYFAEVLSTTKFRLTVLESNIRGRKLYQKIGFKVMNYFPSNLGENKFIVMIKE